VCDKREREKKEKRGLDVEITKKQRGIINNKVLLINRIGILTLNCKTDSRFSVSREMITKVFD
jgi:hypothetical protein